MSTHVRQAETLRATSPRALARQSTGDPADAARHFQQLLLLETDCWDVHEALKGHEDGFVVLDVRSPQAFATGHVPGAIQLSHGAINEEALGAYPADTLFVVYCDGPQCNGADRAALRL